MTTTTPVPLTDHLTPDAAEYAALLLAHDFTVYANPTNRRPARWFHYSRVVDGRECFGTFSDGSESFNGAYHTMPITPSRLNGSSAFLGRLPGDEVTLDPGSMPVLSVAYARAVARPLNWCPFNAEPTREAVARAATGRSVPKRFYRGAMLPNATPWGIGTVYLPFTADALGDGDPAREVDPPEHTDLVQDAMTGEAL